MHLFSVKNAVRTLYYNSVPVRDTVKALFLGLVLTLTLSTLVTTNTTPSATMSNEKEVEVLQGNGVFTKNLYQVLAKEPGNLIFSPISVHAVLSMAYQGSGGKSKEAFANTLKVADIKSAAEGYNLIMSRLNSVENVTLLMANKLYINDGSKLLEPFKTAIVKNFLSEVQPVNFGANTETAATINKWVEEKTKNKIKDLISPTDLDALTRLVLVNAIYFKGNWADKFDPANTRTEPFYLNDNDKVDVQMMHIKKKYNYKEDATLNAKVLEMPYANKDVSLVVILPNEKNGIADLEKKLADVDLTTITENMRKVEVQVSLPKFKIEQTIALNEPLIEMGLGEIFDENKADLSAMLEGKEPLFVSKVVQKAFIEVNEEGAEAAAATGMIMGLRCALPMRPTLFVSDHPFIFLLVQKQENILKDLLFGGRVAQF